MTLQDRIRQIEKLEAEYREASERAADIHNTLSAAKAQAYGPLLAEIERAVPERGVEVAGRM